MLKPPFGNEALNMWLQKLQTRPAHQQVMAVDALYAACYFIMSDRSPLPADRAAHYRRLVNTDIR
eukprot:5964706-Pleurochrysis_carterae.AAC.1